MKKATTEKGKASTPKKTYRTPQIKTLGNVKRITLKTGSAVDGFGTFG